MRYRLFKQDFVYKQIRGDLSARRRLRITMCRYLSILIKFHPKYMIIYSNYGPLGIFPDSAYFCYLVNTCNQMFKNDGIHINIV